MFVVESILVFRVDNVVLLLIIIVLFRLDVVFVSWGCIDMDLVMVFGMVMLLFKLRKE